jgi:hypothetical protein
MTDFTVATTICKQMGGISTLKMFVNARDFVSDYKSMMFKFSGSRKFNFCKVTYDYGMDLYTMSFIKIHGTSRKEEKIEGVYCDMLVSLFEEKTGLFLHF